MNVLIYLLVSNFKIFHEQTSPGMEGSMPNPNDQHSVLEEKKPKECTCSKSTFKPTEINPATQNKNNLWNPMRENWNNSICPLKEGHR